MLCVLYFIITYNLMLRENGAKNLEWHCAFLPILYIESNEILLYMWIALISFTLCVIIKML